MRDYWAVTTCPRPGLPDGYMPGFFAGLRARAVWPLPGPLREFNDVGARGQAWNFLRALRAGVELGAERLHVFEDDTRPCVGAFERVASLEVPRGALFVDWCALRIPMHVMGPRFEMTPTVQFLGLQAVTFTRAAAIEILAYVKISPWPHVHLGDVLVARALSPGYYARHLPGIFEHVGEVSVCSPAATLDAERRSRTFDPLRDARAIGDFS